MLQATSGSSLYLTHAIDSRGKEVLEDLLLNGVTGFSIEQTIRGPAFTVNFITEELADIAVKQTNWSKTSDNKQLKGFFYNLGIIVDQLLYQRFELLCYEPTGALNG